MTDSFLIVAQQVLILFILIGAGFVCGKKRLITDSSAKHMTDIVLYLVTPCVIIRAFQRELDVNMLGNLGISCLAALFIHLGTILLCRLVIRDKNEGSKKVLQFGAVFSNCAFMSIPLQQALLGNDGVFYAGAFIAVFNVFVWTYGLFSMSGDKSVLSVKKLIFNPGIIGVVIGLALYLSQLLLPEIIITPISYLADLNTPLPMLIIGFYLSQSDLRRAFADINSYITMAIRLVAVPLTVLFVMLMLGIRGAVLVSCIISCAAPIAAITTMFSAKFNRDTELSVSIVSATTLLSIVTMPLIVGLAQSFS